MKTVTTQTQHLTGKALDWAVGVAFYPGSFQIVEVDGELGIWKLEELCGTSVIEHDYSPSTKWSQLGPLIDKTPKVDIHTPFGSKQRAASVDGRANVWYYGKDALEAACRAIVAAKLGDTVDVPEVLV